MALSIIIELKSLLFSCAHSDVERRALQIFVGD